MTSQEPVPQPAQFSSELQQQQQQQQSKSPVHLEIRRGSENSLGEKPARSPPPLTFNLWSKKKSIMVCGVIVLFFDLVLPCILYYSLVDHTRLAEKDLLGVAIASLGLGELLELPLRGYRLVKHRSRYGPLGDDGKWHFDAVFWWYLSATAVGAVPYCIATCLEEAVRWLFLMSPGIIIGYANLTMAVSAVPFPIPFRLSSDPRGTACKPFVYYCIEDFCAVDAGQGRSFRSELLARYSASPVFRRLMWELNAWWIVGGIVFNGALAGITWGTSFQVAYGLSFGTLFIWIGVWTISTMAWVNVRLKDERNWYESAASSSTT